MTSTPSTSILRSLRSLIPIRVCTFDEALQIAEAQATRLIEHIRSLDPACEGVQAHHLAAMPRLRIAYEPLPVSGMSHWNGKEWIITICETDGPARQRFTALHEYAHIVSHGASDRLFVGTKELDTEEKAERAADYFAGCALVPRRDLKRAWTSGLQTPAALADHFGVSAAAIEVRLDQTGIARERDPEPQPLRARCARPISTPFRREQRFIITSPRYER
jgi:Zn-dependent peptidase ImmA (M78 family)